MLGVLNTTDRPPVATDDTYEVAEDQTLTVSADEGVLDNDTDDGTLLKVAQVLDPSHGSLTLNEDGSFIYTPEAEFSGEDSFTYKAIDDNGQEDEATVTITVNSVNDQPLATDDTYTKEKGKKRLSIPTPGVLLNDADPEGDSLTVRLLSAPPRGKVELNSDGSFEYKKRHKKFEGASFVYEVSDGQGGVDTATVTINR